MKKDNFSFANGGQLELASGLKMGVCVHCSSWHRGLIWLRLVRAASLCEFICMCISSVVFRPCLLMSSHPSGSCILSPHLEDSLNTEGKDLIAT